MRHLPEHRRLLLMQSLLAGDSVKKAASRVGSGNELVTQLLLDTGTACRAYHDRVVRNLAVDGIRCQRVWGFSYVRRLNAYTPEINRGMPREGWAWVALHSESGLVVDWMVASGEATAGSVFVDRVRDRLSTPVILRARGRDVVMEKSGTGGSAPDQEALLARLFGMEPQEDRDEPGNGQTPVPGDFRRRCLNLELALALHFTCHNFLADAEREPPAVRLGLVDGAWTLETLSELA